MPGRATWQLTPGRGSPAGMGPGTVAEQGFDTGTIVPGPIPTRACQTATCLPGCPSGPTSSTPAPSRAQRESRAAGKPWCLPVLESQELHVHLTVHPPNSPEGKCARPRFTLQSKAQGWVDEGLRGAESSSFVSVKAVSFLLVSTLDLHRRFCLTEECHSLKNKQEPGWCGSVD